MTERTALLSELVATWHRDIPLTAAMGVVVESYDGLTLAVRAPLPPNRNLHGTVFAGSLFSVCALTGWGAIWLALASANTDESYYDRPFEFDIHREVVGDHLAFTKGRHTCLGQPLARTQGSTGLKVLFERLPSLRPDDTIPLDFYKLALLPVRRTLPVHWDVADARTVVAG